MKLSKSSQAICVITVPNIIHCHLQGFSAGLKHKRFVPYSECSLEFCFLFQERQRLETILNICAEFNKNDGPNVMGVCRPSMTQRQRESDEENLREECSSTESTHQDMRTPHNLQNGDNTQVRASPPV